MGNKFKTWSYTSALQERLGDMGHCLLLGVTAKWLMQRATFFSSPGSSPNIWICSYCSTQERCLLPLLLPVQKPNTRKEGVKQTASWALPPDQTQLAAIVTHRATLAADAEHAFCPLAGSYHPSCTGCWGCVALRHGQSWWRCTDSEKEVLVQSQPLNYNKSFGFPWHPSRKVEGTENEVAELLTKIMYAF